MSHFLFIAAALRERTSEESAGLQLSHQVWGICTSLIRTNLQTYLEPTSRGLLYVLKVGLCADFQLLPPVQEYAELDDFLKDELRAEARFGFMRIGDIRQWSWSPQASHALLMHVLKIGDQTELTRRLALGMHRLTQDEYDEIIQAIAGRAANG
ncbi:hypothetical protein [Petrachloros mirabilis]